MKKKSGNPGLRGQLIEKSIEAYILSLETINRLSIKYRIETFTYLICNAWELLLKAKILSDANNQRASIFYKAKEGKEWRSISLRSGLDKIFSNDKEPIRRNIELVETLRDQATHLVISQVPKEILSLFQSCVLNYHKCLNDWFDIALSDRVPAGMMAIVYGSNPEQFDLSNKVLRRQMGAETANYLMQFQAKIKDESKSLGDPAEFYIDIRYKFALVKKLKDGDIELSNGLGGTPTQVIEVPKDSGRTHPYRQKEVVEQVNAALTKTQIKSYDIQCVVKVYKIEKRSDYYYQSSVKGSLKQYSQAFIEWLIEEFNEDNEFFDQVRKKSKELNAVSSTQANGSASASGTGSFVPI